MPVHCRYCKRDNGRSGDWVLALNSNSAGVSASECVAELALVDAIVQKEADPSIAIYLPWVGVQEGELVLGRVVCCILERILLGLLDGDDVLLLDCWVSSQRCYHRVLRLVDIELQDPNLS